MFLNWPRAVFPVSASPLCDSIQETFLNSVLSLKLFSKSPKERIVVAVHGEGEGWIIPRNVNVILCAENNKFFCTYIYYVSDVFSEIIDLCS